MNLASASTTTNASAARRARDVVASGAASTARLRKAAATVAVLRADGGTVTDVEGRTYLDFLLGFGPVLLGHRPDSVVAAVERALNEGIILGGLSPLEAEFAERVVSAVPSVDVVAFSATGTEAIHLAVRVARVQTGRRQIVKFEGHYHGWSDPLFANTPWMPAAESTPVAATHAVTGLAASDDVTIARWGDVESLERALTSGPPVAAVFMEPIPCNYGTFVPSREYMAAVRELCTTHGALLVFDEVLTGFRLALGGAQERLGVLPDLTVMSKALASGFPIALLGGTQAAMAPITQGVVRPGGTFNGSPISLAAGIATLDELVARRDELYPHLDALGDRLATGVRELAAQHSVPLTVNNCGSVLQLFWGIEQPTSYAEALKDDRAMIARLTAALLSRGVHVAERGLVLLCGAHTTEQIDQALGAIDDSLSEIAETSAPTSK